MDDVSCIRTYMCITRSSIASPSQNEIKFIASLPNIIDYRFFDRERLFWALTDRFDDERCAGALIKKRRKFIMVLVFTRFVFFHPAFHRNVDKEQRRLGRD